MKKNHFKLSKNEPVCMFKGGWCVRLGRDGDSLREGGGSCQKYLKKGWNRKEESGNKNFKKGCQAGLRGGCLKERVGGWKPLTNYDTSVVECCVKRCR